MKRRSLLQAVIATPVLAQKPPVPTGPPVISPGETETITIPVVPADQTSAGQITALSEEQMSAFHRLADMLIPPYNNLPGANDARAPEFLAFYAAASGSEKLHLYTSGLDELNRQAQSRFKVAFSATNKAQADEILAPLRDKWEWDAATRNDFRAFLMTAKRDLLRATQNSRVYIEAVWQVARPRNASRFFWRKDAAPNV